MRALVEQSGKIVLGVYPCEFLDTVHKHVQAHKRELLEVFEAFDADHTGTVSALQLGHLIKRVLPESNAWEVHFFKVWVSSHKTAPVFRVRDAKMYFS